VSKQVGDYYATAPTAYREHYIRDAQGNIMATYRYTNTGAASLKLNERPLYGSSRLGSLRKEVELHTLAAFDPAIANPVQMVDLNYELTDHLGNVCAVVTGRLLDGNGGGTAKQAELVSAQGYEPFGSLLPGRKYNSGSSRHLFQGQEHDDEINGGVGSSYAFEYRIHDPRVGRFLSIDPLTGKYPQWTPYSFSGNQVTATTELEGLEPKEDMSPVGGAAPSTKNLGLLGTATGISNGKPISVGPSSGNRGEVVANTQTESRQTSESGKIKSPVGSGLTINIEENQTNVKSNFFYTVKTTHYSRTSVGDGPLNLTIANGQDVTLSYEANLGAMRAAIEIPNGAVSFGLCTDGGMSYMCGTHPTDGFVFDSSKSTASGTNGTTTAVAPGPGLVATVVGLVIITTGQVELLPLALP
jgi:RHS repeat-associated protein